MFTHLTMVTICSVCMQQIMLYTLKLPMLLSVVSPREAGERDAYLMDESSY